MRREFRYLEGTGEIAWEEFYPSTEGLTCAWADYKGFHMGTCPQTAPPYSHIWGWNEDGSELLRGRIDAGHITAGRLLITGNGEKVDCVIRDIITWKPGHERLKVRFYGRDAWPEQMTAVEVLGEQPVTFIAERINPREGWL